MNNYDDYEHNKTNREKRQSPDSFLAWCISCDRAQVSKGCKCPECGNRNGKRTLKRDTNS